jgi:glycosyltransferase involved in cell wall biosynthesis
LYGSQRSLELIVRHLPPAYRRFVSLARSGPLEARLAACPDTTVLHHRRVQWVKHDPRTWLRRIGDATILPLAAIWRAWLLAKVIRREKIDLVHTNSVVSLEGPLAAALTGVPHVWHIRELFMARSPKFHLVLGRWLSCRIIDRFSDAVLCISEAVRQQFGPDVDIDPRYRVIPNALEVAAPVFGTTLVPGGPDIARLRSLCLKVLGLPERDVFRIGYIGRLSEGKGFHELVEALHHLSPGPHEGNPAVELVVAGDFVDDAYRQRIDDLLARYSLASTVRFLGQREDLEPVYAVIDVLAVPSANEAFGRVVIEAMRQGIPCVATAAGGIPEIIEPDVTGLLYPPGEPETLALRLRELMDSSWKRETLRENAGRMVSQRFTIETQIRMLDECYQSVLRHHHL